jgi:hypothetical protein
MDNDLSHINVETSTYYMPYCIWYPKLPRWPTLVALKARRPDMLTPIARACIVADDQVLFDECDPTPDEGIMAEAKASPNPYYLAHLDAKEPAKEVVRTATEQTDALKNGGRYIREWTASKNPHRG